MSDLATTYLRQARSFLRAGDPQRAVDLLERAKVLSRDNREVLAGVLQELGGAYGSVGQPDRAARCREQLASISRPPEAQPGYAQGAYGQGGYGPGAIAGPPMLAPPRSMRPSRGPGAGVWLSAAAAVLVLAVVAFGIYLWPRHEQPVAGAADAAPTTQLAAVQPSPTTAPKPAALGASAASGAQAASGGALEDRLKDNVALIVVMAHYSGTISGKPMSIEMPIASGTAFAVDSGGLMLTCKHVVKTDDIPQEAMPPSLEALGMPTVTRRKVYFLVCFGPEPKFHYDATVAYASDQYDMALVKIDRQFSDPLKLAFTPAHLGEEVSVCGFTGAVVEFLNQATSKESRDAALKKGLAKGKVDLLLVTYSPDSYNSSLTFGHVSAAERHLDGVFYLQSDAHANHGNSGGPVFNSQQQVVGILAQGINNGTDGIFALLLAQLKDELAPYLKFN